VTPGKKRPWQVGKSRRLQKLDDFQKTSIRRKVHDLYRQNIPPTAEKVTELINDDPDLVI